MGGTTNNIEATNGAEITRINEPLIDWAEKEKRRNRKAYLVFSQIIKNFRDIEEEEIRSGDSLYLNWTADEGWRKMNQGLRQVVEGMRLHELNKRIKEENNKDEQA